MRTSIPLASTAALAFLCAASSYAVAIGQIDTFEDGTTQNWRVGSNQSPHPAPPENVLGGPAGSSDHYLRLTAVGGGGSGSRLSVFNLDSQWAGDYIDAAVTSLTMDVINLGTSELHLRFGITDADVLGPDNIAFTSSAVVIPPGSGWTSATFSIELAALQAALGTVENALRNATELRLYHSAEARFPSPLDPIPPVVALMGVDNIRTTGTAVPPPDDPPAPVPDQAATGGLLAASFFGLALMGGIARRPRRS